MLDYVRVKNFRIIILL